MADSNVTIDFVVTGKLPTVAPPRPPTKCDCKDLRIDHRGGKKCSKCPCDIFIPA
jgi:hypothetical protein